MSEERKKIYLGHISQPIAKGAYCAAREADIAFTTPIDLREGDVVAIDAAAGLPLAVYREQIRIWKFEGYYGVVSFKMDYINHELLTELLQRAGAQASQ